jgi:hypothetical protein
MLREGFPKQLAVAFSRLFRAAFPPLTALSVADLSKPRTNSVIIDGGGIDAHRQVIAWMLACCEGGGIQRFPYFQVRRFWNLTCALESAEILQIDVLQEELWVRLSEIMRHQVHTEDIKAIYSATDKGHKLRTMIAESIAKALLERRIVARPAYITLRQDPQFKDFDDDVNDAIECMKKEHAESDEGKAVRAEKQAIRQKAKEAAQQRYQQRKKNQQQVTAYSLAQHLAVPTDAVTPKKDGSFKVTVSTEVVRKGRKGHGRYAALPLRQAGVTAESFR